MRCLKISGTAECMHPNGHKGAHCSIDRMIKLISEHFVSAEESEYARGYNAGMKEAIMMVKRILGES